MGEDTLTVLRWNKCRLRKPYLIFVMNSGNQISRGTMQIFKLPGHFFSVATVGLKASTLVSLTVGPYPNVTLEFLS